MRVFLVGAVLLLAAVGAAQAGGDEAGCTACTERNQAKSESLKALQAASEARGDCQIKGDITMEGDRLYHAPGGRLYKWIWISESRGERWFCSAEEAEAAGWRPADE